MDMKILCLCVFVTLTVVVDAKGPGAEHDVGKAIKHLFHEKIEKKMKEAATEVQDILQDNLVKHVKDAAKSILEAGPLKKAKKVKKVKKVKKEEKPLHDVIAKKVEEKEQEEKAPEHKIVDDANEEPPIEGDEAMIDPRPKPLTIKDVEGKPAPGLEPIDKPKTLPRLCNSPCPQTCAPACDDRCCYPDQFKEEEEQQQQQQAMAADQQQMDQPMDQQQMNGMPMDPYGGQMGYPSNCPSMCMDQCAPSCPQQCCSWDKKHKIHHPKKHHKKHHHHKKH